jgi:hypothetical protein
MARNAETRETYSDVGKSYDSLTKEILWKEMQNLNEIMTKPKINPYEKNVTKIGSKLTKEFQIT